MNLIYPNFLWALMGLTVPLAIHLWSKRKVPIIKIGSVQFLKEPDTRQSSSIQLNEWWLLALRMLAIVFLALTLAGPQLKIPAENVPITYLVEPSLLGTTSLEVLWDTLPEGSVRLLLPGFPELDQHDSTQTSTPKYWQLAKDMETLHTDSIVVYTRALLNGLRGMRPAVDIPVQWVVINPGKPFKSAVEAQMNGKEIRVISVLSDDSRLIFEKEYLPIDSDRLRINTSGDSVLVDSGQDSTLVPLRSDKEIRVHIYYTDSLQDQKEYMVAAFRAISRYSKRKVTMEVSKEADTLDNSPTDYVVWLSHKPVPDTKAKTLVYDPLEAGNSLIEQGLADRFYYQRKHLDVENITAGHLMGELVHFLNLHADLDKELPVMDRRVASTEELTARTNLQQPPRHYTASLDMAPWFLLLLGITLVLERIVAKVRNQ